MSGMMNSSGIAAAVGVVEQSGGIGRDEGNMNGLAGRGGYSYTLGARVGGMRCHARSKGILPANEEQADADLSTHR